MLRKIIRIDEEKCNGCGACAAACHEGAIEMIDGKARLTREDYCDGLGDCLPTCPMDAISFEMREAPAYDHAAVLAAKARKEGGCQGGGCPGTQARSLRHKVAVRPRAARAESHLAQWPVQIKLAPLRAPYFYKADLLIAADCTAYACGHFHETFMKGRVTLIGCPKLDAGDYAEKLAAILQANEIRSLTVVRMEVPCCGGMEQAVRRALAASGKEIPLEVITLTTEGRIRD